MSKKRIHKKITLKKNKKDYIPKIVIVALFLLILSLVAYIVLTVKFQEEIPLEEKTPALNIVYKPDTPKDNIVSYKEYKDIVKENKLKKIQQIVKIKKKPKLAIVVDDVSFLSHVKTIQNIGYPITMAFLPPTSRHQNSAKIAQGLPYYMIHFPLEARSFKFAEANTLKISDSYETIEQRVQALRLLYPKAKYTNNHTGSKFTSNKQAMDKLMKALKKYNIGFLDSRTTSKSVAKQSAQKYGVNFLSRNIFLDNKQDRSYIRSQLKKAVNIAKKTGEAIAICHPKKITFQTLKNSKDLLKDVELVLVNQL